MPARARRAPVAKVDQPSFEIANYRVEPGSRIQFNMPAAQLYTNTPLELPVEIVHGRRSGPVLLVCAAIHGDELNGVEIIRRLRILPVLSRLRGTLLLVPVVNLFGFIHQSRYLPDRRDLNRCFPGSVSGSLASRLANLFFSEIVTRSTHIIDLHTAAIHRENTPQVRAALDEPGVDAMARAFGIPVIVNAGQIDGSLRCEAGKVGIPVLTYEAGEALRLDEGCIVPGVRGIVSVMREIDMLPPARRRRVRAEPYVTKSTRWYRANADGMFRPLVRLGSQVRSGEVMGIISAPFGTDQSTLRAKHDGIVIGVTNLPLVNEGDALFNLASFKEADLVEGEITAQQEAVENDPLYQLGEGGPL